MFVKHKYDTSFQLGTELCTINDKYNLKYEILYYSIFIIMMKYMANILMTKLSNVSTYHMDMYNGIHDYWLGTGESYGPTAQHTQDCLMFFIQLNHVYKIKRKHNKVLLLYDNSICHKVAHFLFFSFRHLVNLTVLVTFENIHCVH